MKTISKILIPYNFSASAEKALDYALNFSLNAKSTSITLLYVMQNQESDISEKEVEQKLALLVDDVKQKKSSIECQYQISKGKLVPEVFASKNKLEADLIVMGTSGTRLDDQRINTNTSALVSESSCPVLVIPKGVNEFKIKNITLAIDKNAIEHPEALSTLLDIARRFDAKIHVLTIYEEGDDTIMKEHQAENILEYYFEKYYSTTSVTASAHVAQSIIDYDKKQSIDMLAIMPHKNVENGQVTGGRLTHYLTTNTDIPILTID